MAIADEIIVINQGRVRDCGPPDAIYLRPKNHFAAAFMGEANFISGRLSAMTGDGITIDTAFGRHSLPRAALVDEAMCPGDLVELCFRPEHFRSGRQAGGGLNLGAGVVSDTAFFGTHHRVHIVAESGAGETFVVHMPQTVSIAAGERVELELGAGDVIVLPANMAD